MSEHTDKKTDKYVITIDGPAASGKSSVSRELARRFGWSWVSTGAFYRGLAFVARAEKVDLADAKALARLAESDVWSVRADLDNTNVFYRGTDVSQDVNHESVGSIASKTSSIPEVRASLLPLQRKLAKPDAWLIAEGRDCGSVVFPNAAFKVYLTARSDARAQRRADEHGENAETVLKAQKERDQLDQQRTVAPLQVPEGAVVVDTSEMGFLDVVDHVEALIRKTLAI